LSSSISSSSPRSELSKGEATLPAPPPQRPHQSFSTRVLIVVPPLRRISPPRVLHRHSLGSCDGVTALTGTHHGWRRQARHRFAPLFIMDADDGALVPHRSN
jgi:hypothetical protein